MRRWLMILSGTVAALFLLGCPAFVVGTKVVFASDRTGRMHIYIMGIGGQNPVQLTFGNFDDYDPAFSPRGDRIAFVSDRGGTGNLELFTMNADGTNLLQRTADAGDQTDPSWSYDGRRIAFCFSVGGGNRQIWVYDTLTSNFTQITSIGDNQNPSFHPNGLWIVFGSNRNGSYDVYRADAFALESNVVRLTFDAEDSGDPAYSPDGAKICFVSYRTGTPQIFRMNSDGSNQVQLTFNLNQNFAPHYTPDSKSIVWTLSGFGANGEIYRMRDDGSNVVNLTQHPANDQRPTAARTNF